ncbi:MAG: PhoH family protein [Alphaproteobacteria bacterium]
MTDQPSYPPVSLADQPGEPGAGMADPGRVFPCSDLARQADLCGQNDRHLALIEQKLNVTLFPRGDHIEIKGASDARVAAHGVLERLSRSLDEGRVIDENDVAGAVRLVLGSSGRGAPPPDVVIRTQKKVIEPRSVTQSHYMDALRRNELVFGIGPAGTGKTYLAVAHGVSLLLARQVDRLILSRPAVEAGERLGFLPGDMREKVDPYLRPLFDALNDTMIGDQVQRRLGAGDIEVAPLAFMRGRTLANAFVILDEAQNTTTMQMKMFLTRLGDQSRMVITGDPTQVDLPPGQSSGLVEACSILQGVEGVSFVHFTDADVVRHPLVARIVKAYNAAAMRRGEGRRGEGRSGEGHGADGS